MINCSIINPYATYPTHPDSIRESEVDRIKLKIERKEATRIEKLELSKYYFDANIDSDLSPEDKQFYFTMNNDLNMKTYLKNMRLELGLKTELELGLGLG
jgi:hypothetical protein